MLAAPERIKLVNGDRYVYVDSEASEAAWISKGYNREGVVVEAAPSSTPPKPPARGKKG